MLWDLIRDFFVEHVFGGLNSQGVLFQSTLGRIDTFINGTMDDAWNANTSEISFLVGKFTLTGEVGDAYITFADWLSTTATLISITLIVVLCCMFIYKIIKLIGGLIR